MYIGNIVSESILKIDDSFNVVNDIGKIDKKVPTLIIGWDFSKSIFSSLKLSILDKEINKDVNWTFSKKERRIDYEKDLKLFTQKCLNNIENNLKYKYINILTCDRDTLKNLLKKLSSTDVSYIYIYNNSFIYIYINNEIIGIDFNSIDYLKINRKRVYRLLYGRNNKIFFNDDFLSNEIKEIISDKKRITPYLYAIKNGEKR